MYNLTQRLILDSQKRTAFLSNAQLKEHSFGREVKEDLFLTPISNEKSRTLRYTSELESLTLKLKEEKEINRMAFYVYSQMKLPVEIWERIFLLAVQFSSRLNPAYTLSRVCRYWRTVALNYSILWAHTRMIK